MPDDDSFSNASSEASSEAVRSEVSSPEASSEEEIPEKATIYDVASESGTSVATVSRVINDADNVADQTRERVEAAIAHLSYRPDRTARSLAEQQIYTLAVALPSFITPFHNELMKGIRLSLRGRPGFDLLVHDLGSEDPYAELARFLQQGTVDGLLVAGATVDEASADELRAWRAPAVLIGDERDGLDSFTWDDAAGARAATEHLIEQGHERIGLIRTRNAIPLQERRVEGYRAALEDAGLPFDASLVVSGQTAKHAGFSEEAGQEAMRQLLEADPPVTAVFCSSDVHAVGAWAALYEAGRSVPEDIALVGYDDVKTSRFLGLSSVAQRMHEVGERAVQRLLHRMRQPNDAERVDERMTPTLQVRRSSKR
jgi:LacI family transcriptional regulator